MSGQFINEDSSENTSAQSGGCLCGRCRFILTAPISLPPILTTALIADDKMPVDAYGIRAPADGLILLTDDPVIYTNNAGDRTEFCGICATRLLFHPAADAGHVIIPVDNFDIEGLATPDSAIALDAPVPTDRHTHGPGVIPLITGGCRCGSLRFAASADPVSAGYCHCETCRQRSGALAEGYCLIERRAFAVTHGHVHMYGGNHACAIYGFCRTCAGILFHPPTKSNPYFRIPAVALDDRTYFQPREHVHIEQKHPCLDITGDDPEMLESAG